MNHILTVLLAASIELLSAQGNIQSILNKADVVYGENPAESFSLCEQADRTAKSSGDHSFDPEIAICKARYYILIAKYDAASFELNQAILVYQNKDDLRGLTLAYSLKSILLERIGDKAASHTMQLRVVELNRELKDMDALITSLNNLSLDYWEEDQSDSMLLVMEELESLEEHFHPTDYLYYYQNWGHYYGLTADHQRAIQQYESALKVAEEEKMTDSKATNLASLSRAYRNNGQLKNADKMAEESYRFSQENNLIYETADALNAWIAAKESLGDYAEAFELQKKWMRVDKKIYDLERIQKVKAIEGQLEIAEKEKEIVEGEIALKEANLKGQKAQTRNAWLTGIILLVIVLLSFTIFIYVKTRKLNQTIQHQKEEVEIKSLRLEDALGSIQDSLAYAKMIQASMLPSAQTLKESLNEHFTLYKPKDIVSGDFYWLHEADDCTILAVGDCTGHGVPGAMVSMVCHEALNKVVIEQAIIDPAEILNKVRDLVINTFQRQQNELSDGMDICLIKLKGRKLEYAGANNNLWLYSDRSELPKSTDVRLTSFPTKELIELKADKQPIGKYHHIEPFSTKAIELCNNDTVYLFSDGYADQFGGQKGKKLKTANLKEIIAKCQPLSMKDQCTHLDQLFEEWRGELEQVDDVCILGFKHNSNESY